jgi:hypothetical protein
MASINYAFKEISCKIVYYGPGVCGKTTNLQAIHATVPPKFRGDLVSLATEQDRTLFFDFLPLDLGEVRGFKTKFQLYTVPGQVYYNATRQLVLRGVDGVVFVADSAADRMEDNRESLANLRENLESYGLNLDQISWVIQFNKRDLPNAVPRDEMEALLNPDHVPSMESIASKGIGVKETLKAIAALVLRRLSDITESAPAASSLERKAAAAAEQQVPRSQKVSLVASGSEPRSPVPAPAGETVAAAASTPSGAPPPPRPATAAAPSVAPARTTVELPDLHVMQKCDARWRGFRVGTAVVEITRRAGADRRASYALACQATYLQLFRRMWKCMLQLSGEETKVIDYHSVSFYAFQDVAAEGKKGGEVHVWIKNAFDKACYVSFSGFGSTVQLTPAGRSWFE